MLRLQENRTCITTHIYKSPEEQIFTLSLTPDNVCRISKSITFKCLYKGDHILLLAFIGTTRSQFYPSTV